MGQDETLRGMHHDMHKPRSKTSRTKSYDSVDKQDETDEISIRDRFRNAFESKFKPLKPLSNPDGKSADHKREVSNVEEQEDSDWSGISSEDADAVELVEHVGPKFDGSNAQKSTGKIGRAHV